MAFSRGCVNRACLCSAVKNAFRRVSHVIFDCDGLLLDTEKIYTEAINHVLKPYGKTLEWSLKIQIMGMPGIDTARTIVNALDLPLTPEEFYELMQKKYRTLSPNCLPMPDTEGIYKRTWADIAKEHGKVYTKELQMKVLGIPDIDGAKIYLKELQIPLTQNSFLSDFRKRAAALLPTCEKMPGAERLVKHLHKNNIPMAVATSATQASTEIKSVNHKKMFSLFRHVVTGGSDPEVKHGKPKPDIYLICASRFKDKPKPEQCLVFEDAPNGVTAAISAGMQCVMVPDPQVEQRLTQHATLVIKSLEEVQLELFGLPPLK